MSSATNDNQHAELARFEFRSFGQDFERAGQRMARLSMPVPEKFWERNSEEIYILSRHSDTANIKIREQTLTIKSLVRVVDKCEQWNPTFTTSFPVPTTILRTSIFPYLHFRQPEFDRNMYTLDEFIELVNHHPQLQVVNVHKQRFGYMVNDTICETGNILVNGAKVLTISTESTNMEDVVRTIKQLGLASVENINYVQAIKRIIGMINKPLAN